MKKKPTVTIGIPAYNEEANIGYLLRDLLKQKRDSFILEKIVVNSDGSRDGTLKEVNKIKSSSVKLIVNKNRKGQAERQNEVIKTTSSDILVLLNADVAVKNKFFLKRLILPIIDNKADYTSGNILPLKPSNYFDKILFVSVLLKKDIYDNFNDGDNVLTCHGPARAFSKKYYRSFSFRTSIGEDAYSYFWGKEKGFVYKYAADAILYYMLPGNYKDHENQSVRFLKSSKIMEEKFGKDATRSYKLPTGLTFKYLFIHFLKTPVEIVAYIAILIFIKFTSIYKNIDEQWTMSTSSKVLK